MGGSVCPNGTNWVLNVQVNYVGDDTRLRPRVGSGGGDVGDEAWKSNRPSGMTQVTLAVLIRLLPSEPTNMFLVHKGKNLDPAWV